MFIGLLNACTKRSFGESLASNSEGHIKCVSPNNVKLCQARPLLDDVNSDETFFYPFIVSVVVVEVVNYWYSIYKSTWNNLNEVKNMNAKVFNLISGVNERFLVHHELCETKCRSNGSVCNSKQNWNYDECWCEYKELDDWSSCKDDYMWDM